MCGDLEARQTGPVHQLYWRSAPALERSCAAESRLLQLSPKSRGSTLPPPGCGGVVVRELGMEEGEKIEIGAKIGKQV